MIALFLVVYSSHVKYTNNFNMNVTNQSLYYNSSTNKTVYTGTLHYSSFSGNYVYVMFFGSNTTEFWKIGTANQSVIPNPAKCQSNDTQCLINTNKIYLNSSAGTYTIKAYISNSTFANRVKDATIIHIL